MLIFIKKIKGLLLGAIKLKVHVFIAYKLIESYKPTRFTILICFRSLKPINFNILTRFAEKMARNVKFSNFA